MNRLSRVLFVAAVFPSLLRALCSKWKAAAAESRRFRRDVRKLERLLADERGRRDEAEQNLRKVEGQNEVLTDQLAMFHSWRAQETAWREAEAAIHAARKATALEQAEAGERREELRL
jgi:hypothetical protein